MTDESAIRAVVERYFYALDSRNLDLLNDCFTPDALVSILGHERRMDGPASIRATFSGIVGYSASSHFITSQLATVADDRAVVHTLAVAVLVPADGSLISVRGLDYQDHMTRTPEGWRIERRRHEAVWQFNAESTAPVVAHLVDAPPPAAG